MLVRDRLVRLQEFSALSGWHLQAEGLCRGDVCVPIPPAAVRGDVLDLASMADRLHMPLLHDSDAAIWVLGPPATDHVLDSAAAPDLVLPDVHGDTFDLRSLRGRKVLLLAWASW